MIEFHRPFLYDPQLLLRFVESSLGALHRDLLGGGGLTQIGKPRAEDCLLGFLKYFGPAPHLIFPKDTAVAFQPLARARDFVRGIFEQRARLAEITNEGGAKRL